MIKVFVNGTFDILHPGHLKLLSVARSLGDRVLVATDSDHRVRSLKGPTRPVNPLQHRMAMLRGLKCVDHVVSFDSDEKLLEIIEDYNPKWMVKGSDYINKPILGRSLVDNIIFVETTDDSTTKIIKRIADR